MTEPVLPGLYETPTTAKLNPVKVEKDRLNAASRRVLAFLKDRGPAGAMNYELCRPEVGGLRAVGRIDELREHYLIDKEHVEKGAWRYIYRGYR